jgi:hypothetical protein
MTSAQFGILDVKYNGICESHSQWYMVSGKQPIDNIFSQMNDQENKRACTFVYGSTPTQLSSSPRKHAWPNALYFAPWK